MNPTPAISQVRIPDVVFELWYQGKCQDIFMHEGPVPAGYTPFFCIGRLGRREYAYRIPLIVGGPNCNRHIMDVKELYYSFNLKDPYTPNR